MQTVKMYQLERNLGQLCDINRKCFGGSPCLQIQLAFIGDSGCFLYPFKMI